mmetsp:Transcript_113911/g.201024  ORF Transcript_113911/g.201024 Transcript_113911/m.201024 type:complete len:112 (+) Transcript_113911:748-1083(+)
MPPSFASLRLSGFSSPSHITMGRELMRAPLPTRECAPLSPRPDRVEGTKPVGALYDRRRLARASPGSLRLPGDNPLPMKAKQATERTKERMMKSQGTETYFAANLQDFWST